MNDGIPHDLYVDGPITVTLPTVHDMERRILELGQGAFLYKSDLARAYRQLRIDPFDWDLLGFRHEDYYYVDICPPFGLRSSAMMMVRTTRAINYLHARAGFTSFAYIDDFGGGERDTETAQSALGSLQNIFDELGVQEAPAKVCPPSQVMTWLGIQFNTRDMTMSLPEAKIQETRECLEEWTSKHRASLKEIQSIFGLLQFVSSVAPPAKLFTNRILDTMRDLDPHKTTVLSWGFRRDIKFFSDMMPNFKGVKMMDKADLPAQHLLELDACLSGCGAISGEEFYGREFPEFVQAEGHTIAHLEMLNIVVAVKLWWPKWSGYKVRIYCDNMNSVLALQSSRARDPYMQACAREIYLYTARHDILLLPSHCPGVAMERADALSREHLERRYSKRVARDPILRRAKRVRPTDDMFCLINEL